MSIINADAYRKLIAGDVEWLLAQPRSLERDHIEVILRWQFENAAAVVDAELLKNRRAEAQKEVSL